MNCVIYEHLCFLLICSGHKKGIDADEARRKRETMTFDLRKSKRDDLIQKRRLKSDGSKADPTVPGENDQHEIMNDTVGIEPEILEKVFVCS